MFVVALTERDEDARSFNGKFDPNWLTNKELVPILDSIFAFRNQHGMTPSFATLHEYMEEKDKDLYKARWKTTINSLETKPKDVSKMVLTLDKAKSTGASLALSTLIHSQDFQIELANGNGKKLNDQLSEYLRRWGEQVEGEGMFNIREAFDKLIQESTWAGKPSRIGSGIYPIDLWTNGGLRPGQLGILIAPTGGGKSATLANIALYAAQVEQQGVLLITNEMTVNEQSERLLVRMQVPKTINGKLIYRSLQEIQDDPSIVFKQFDSRWSVGLDKLLYIESTDLGQTADNIEEEINKLRRERGFKPKVIVIDYMERMAPKTRVNREKEWIYLQEVAKELVRLAKRLDAIIWTAVQTNRSGLSAKVELNMSHGQGSIRHFQEAAFVATLQKVIVPMSASGEKDVKCLLFAEQKQRHNSMEDRKMLVKHDLSRMFISKEEVEVPNDAEVEVQKDDNDTKQKGILSPWKAKGGT